MQHSAVLAVDFGTSTSVGAVAVDDQVHLLKEPATGSWTWPSAVALDGSELLVGTPAENVRRVDPLGYRGEFKRDLGDPSPVPLGDKTFRPEDLVVELLGALGQQADELLERPVARTVITVPASYGEADARRDLMIGAGEAAGLGDVELLTEPVAAAFAPLRGGRLPAGTTVLVYDLGGGTFDAAVVRIGAHGEHEVLGHAALDDCGGRDIDAALFTRLRAVGGAEMEAVFSGDGPDGAADVAYSRMELLGLVQRAKHHLTHAATARDWFAPLRRRITVEAAELGEAAGPIVARTLECCWGLVDGLEIGTVDAVLMVGGSTRMPIVRAAVAAGISDRLRFVEDATTAVAHGAALWGRQAERRSRSPRDPAPEERPLRWDVPGGRGVLTRWLVTAGDPVTPGQPLALVRLVDGALWTFTSDDRGGRVLRLHADAGAAVVSGDWLVTVRAGPTPAPASTTTQGGWQWSRSTGGNPR